VVEGSLHPALRAAFRLALTPHILWGPLPEGEGEKPKTRIRFFNCQLFSAVSAGRNTRRLLDQVERTGWSERRSTDLGAQTDRPQAARR